MKKELKVEFYRAFHSRWMLLALATGMSMAVSHVVMYVLPLMKYVKNNPLYPLSSFGKWLGGESTSVFSSMYFFVVPILIAVPYAGTLKEDLMSGYIRNVTIRVPKKTYFAVKFIVSFVTCGLIGILPLTVNFMLTAAALPSIIPQANTSTFPIFANSMMGDLFYQHPFWYLVLYLAIDFVFFGLLGAICLPAAYVCSHLFTTILTPFILYLLVFEVTGLIHKSEWCPFSFLRPSQPLPAQAEIIAAECLLMCVAGGVYLYAANKSDIL